MNLDSEANMIKPISIYSILVSIGLISNGWATQCPYAAQLTHSTGLAWTMDSSYVQAGWKIAATKLAQLSDQTQMPAQATLYVQLYPQNKSATRASCNYVVGGDTSALVMVYHSDRFDPATVPVPPFSANFANPLGFRCDTQAATADACSWGIDA
jgi:hypothetical protein